MIAPDLREYHLVAFLAFIGWGATLTILALLKAAPRPVFVAAHYLLNVAVFGGLFAAYFAARPSLSPFAVMAGAMTVILVAEWLLWNFVFPGRHDFLNFVDWMLPAFLLASTIYLVGKWYAAH
jgi:hypothetical protein